MFKKVAPYMGEYKKYTIRAIILMCIGIVANVMPYFFLYQIISPLTKGESISLNYVLLRVLAVLVCEVIYSFSYVKGLIFSHISAYNTLKNLRVSLQGKLEKKSLGNIQSLGTGRIKKVFTEDIDMIELLLAHAIPEGIANIVIPILIIILMFAVDFRLGLLSFVPLVLGVFAMGMMMKQGFAKMNAYYESAAVMNNTIIEYVNGMEVVKVFNKDGDSYKKFGEVVRNYRDFTLAWYKACWPWMAMYSSILPCLALLILPVGAYWVIGGTLALDKLILVLCMSFAVGPSVLKALNLAGKFPQLDYKITELENLMDKPPLKEGTSKFTGKNRDIKFENVKFAYEDKEILHGVNLDLKQGSTTALVGESGSGKSTLAKLLVHYYDLNDGKITIGGQDITDMSLEALNNEVSYVAQEQFLFNTTIYENILIGKPDATREEVLEAARRAQCDEFLTRLPNGIDTMAGDGGKQLSGGERQRISLARAILKNAPIIVLDEATAFMDPENEEKLNAAIDEITKDKTVFVIAHRLSTVKNADKICVMKEGQCIAADKHDKLLESCPEYKKFWDASVSASTWKIKGEEKAC
ncbi:MAG: ABC transporter ATP-binding protein [Pseudobutyrivibrio sp.]|uniref:ABC transporter ATP-binding protein n=1 Tax=Pseudobutyrivibrio sp. TaxID=2014367 RepID=UPI0025EE706F|nr:ABC transporter ATP-binding protein [Pseudobutyrivibrio sp.]MBE5903189.1 ABC transporter ATP-binding protein [Pseudobutyrivibrio sp.]